MTRNLTQPDVSTAPKPRGESPAHSRFLASASARLACGAAIAALASLATLTASAQVRQDPRPVIKIAQGAEDIGTLDPHRATSLNDKAAAAQIFNALVRFAPGSADSLTFEPDLAEKWETSLDMKEWTFQLRRGVQFHGEWGDLTSADVVYSYQRAADPARSSFASNFAVIDKVEALDPYRVRFTLKYPDFNFLGRVANYHAGHIVSQKAAEKLGPQFGSKPVGTGPFAFAEHVTQQYVRLVANDRYFRGKPKLGGITYRMVPSLSSRELAFNSGELDLIYGKREQRWVERARKSKGASIDVFQPGEYHTLFINRSIKPLDDVRVRRAIAMAIDLDEIQKFVGVDIAAKGCSVVPRGYMGEDCSKGGYSYKLIEARKLLADAGYPNGFAVTSIVSNLPGLQSVMEVIQAQLSRAGIKVEMNVVDHATYQAQSRKNLSALILYGAARFPNADAWLTEFYDSAAIVNTPKAMSNFSHCSIADAEIRAARIEPVHKTRMALWKTAQEKMYDDVCGVPLFDQLQVWARRNNVSYGYDLKGAMSLAPPITEKTMVGGK